MHISSLKQALNHGLKLKNVHAVIEFKQKAWMKPYIDKNTKLRSESKNAFEKGFFKLMNNAVFGKTMENLRKHTEIKLVTSNGMRKNIASEPNYHSCKCFSERFMATEMIKTKTLMNKPANVGQAVLDISKTLMYEFWYDYLNPKYGDKVKLCYMDTDSFIFKVGRDDFYKDTLPDLNKRYDTSKIKNNIDEN